MTIEFSRCIYQDHLYAGIGQIQMFHKLHMCPVVRSILRSDLHLFSSKIDKWEPWWETHTHTEHIEGEESYLASLDVH